jgi:hypothetical protein
MFAASKEGRSSAQKSGLMDSAGLALP